MHCVPAAACPRGYADSEQAWWSLPVAGVRCAYVVMREPAGGESKVAVGEKK